MAGLDPAAALMGHVEPFLGDRAEQDIRGRLGEGIQPRTLLLAELREDLVRIIFEAGDHLPAIEAGGTFAQLARVDDANREPFSCSDPCRAEAEEAAADDQQVAALPRSDLRIRRDPTDTLRPERRLEAGAGHCTTGLPSEARGNWSAGI